VKGGGGRGESGGANLLFRGVFFCNRPHGGRARGCGVDHNRARLVIGHFPTKMTKTTSQVPICLDMKPIGFLLCPSMLGHPGQNTILNNTFTFKPYMCQ
jgi:hypothetical protein